MVIITCLYTTLVSIFKLNLESRGMFAELSCLTIILAHINIIMLNARRIRIHKIDACSKV